MSSSHTAVPITVAHGDGIGPAIMDAVLFLLKQAGAALDIDTIEVGREVYESGHSTGIKPEAWDSLRRTGVLLKAPITTPQGKGYKSLNVTIRKTLGMFANVRPCPTYAPFIPTAHPGMDVVIVRENEEDTYGGIEHRQTPEVTQCLKLISRPGCERICRYAFEYARHHERKTVSCFVKDNIMKITDGLFHEVFDQVAAGFPDINSEVHIVDIGSARLANEPTQFDVICLPNLYGDIVSDIAAEIAGSVGLAGSANIGDEVSMFEAIHGSAPDIAGKGVANPSGLLHGALMMLDHIGQGDVAQTLHNAWLRTIEEGVVTADIRDGGTERKYVGTDAFAHAVANRLGQSPETLKPVVYASSVEETTTKGATRLARPVKRLEGVDIFLDWDEGDRDPNELGKRLNAIADSTLPLTMITNRGTKVFPDGLPETFCTDHWRCRFTGTGSDALTNRAVIDLLTRIEDAGIDFIKMEHLYSFDGERGYSRGQGE
ncbi:MAG: NADP-dependent isocitrate dehydrogenase [Planctomycetota bacterium]